VQASLEQDCVTVLQKIALCKRLWKRIVLHYCSKLHCASECGTELCYRIAANCTVQETVEQNCVTVLQKIALCKQVWNTTLLEYCSKLHCARDFGTELCCSIAANCTVQETVEQNCVTVLQQIALYKRLWNRTVLQYCRKLHCASKCGTPLCYSIAANCTVQETVEQNCVRVLQQIALCKRVWNRTVLHYCSKLQCASDCGTELCYSIASNCTVQTSVEPNCVTVLQQIALCKRL